MSLTALDHASEAILKLAEQYRGKENVESLLSAACAELQILEDTFWDVLNSRALDTATSAQLSVLGALVGQERNALTLDDDLYRLCIRARIALNRSAGAIPEVLTVFEGVFPTGSFTLTELPPASFTLRVSGAVVDDDTAALLLSFLTQARAAAVKADLIYEPVTTANILTLDSGPGLDQGTLANSLES